MAILGEILISIKASAGQFISEVKTAGDATNKFVDALDKHKSTIKEISRVFAIASGAMAGALAYTISEAANAERVDARLSQSLLNVGISSSKTAANLSDLASQIEKTSAFGDEELKTTMATLINMTGDYNVALNHTQTVADVARAAQIDLNTAARLVGQAYLGNTGALTRYGIVIDKGKTGMEALAILHERFAGAAFKFSKTFTGQMDSLKNSIGNIAEKIGLALLPALNKFLDSINKIARNLENMTDEQATAILKFGLLATAITGGIALLGTLATSLVSIRAAFLLTQTGATALFTTLMAHPFVAMAASVLAVVSALTFFGNKIVEDQNKHAAFKASTQGQIQKFTELKDIATRAGSQLVWFAGQQITGTEAAKKYDIILDMLNGKIKTNTKVTKENTAAKAESQDQTTSLTRSLKEAALEMQSEKAQVAAYTGSVVAGFDAMTASVIQNNRLTGEELKIGLKAMLNSMLDYYMQQLSAQLAVYTSMIFNPFTAAAGIGGIGSTLAQMAVLSGLKIGVAMLEDGGITKAGHPILSMIGEGSSPEAIIPLPKLVPIIREAMTTNNNSQVQIVINAGDDLKGMNWDALVKTQIKPALDRNLRMAGA